MKISSVKRENEYRICEILGETEVFDIKKGKRRFIQILAKNEKGDVFSGNCDITDVRVIYGTLELIEGAK